MSTNPTGSVIDLEKIKADAKAAVAGMSKEQLVAEAEKIRVRQKTQQKNQSSKGAQKAYMKAQNEKRKLILAKIEELGLRGEIDAKAESQAEQKHQE